MKQIGLDDRIVFDLNDLINKKYTSIDYDRVNTKLNALRVQSKQYLKKRYKSKGGKYVHSIEKHSDCNCLIKGIWY